MATNTNVKYKSGDQSGSPVLGIRLKRLRVDSLQADQKSFARLLGVSQAIVSQWERGVYVPSAMALIAISKYAPEAERDYWLEQAGPDYLDSAERMDSYNRTFNVDEVENQTVLIFGTIGAGPARFPPTEAEGKLSLPRAWFPQNAQVMALRVVGDSMAPLIDEGAIALIDRAQREPARLDGKIVAIRGEEGFQIKWLRRTVSAKKANTSGYFLFSNNPAYAPIQVDSEGFQVLGKVVRWIGIAKG